ncbi:hypothetical protein CCACVL1_13464 [Corchorus capsularis]|uniref:Uncharacterized protein n=1 Tax=Corchorus capsularis TaxID=210143 RepID=A0A1R3IAY6_COCAP|nr:hypothetical protein CCACVL1_13464 [Corchorus capsularis]
MARLAVIFTVISLLFTISHARFIQVHDVTPDETVNDLPEFDPEKATAILLPSERPGFEPAKLIDFKHDDASETESDVDSLPLTMVSFRPINRHFPRRPIIPFRHKHNCRLHKRRLMLTRSRAALFARSRRDGQGFPKMAPSLRRQEVS